MKNTPNQIKAALSQLGIRPFRNCSGDPKWDAQQNLSWKTHYADEETLRYFKARISSCYKIDQIGPDYGSWSILGIVESIGSKPASIPGGKYRFRLFDVFGREISESEDWFSSAESARKALFRRADEIDGASHTASRIKEEAGRMAREAKLALSLLAGRENRKTATA
jgi:hypothetical protein